MQIRIQELYNKLKENYGMIAIIVSFLGGIWQLIQLSIISPQLIRFFSISQLVADGLLITLFLFISLHPILIIVFSGYHVQGVGSKREERTKNIFRFIIFIFMFYMLYDFTFNNDLATIKRLAQFIYSFSFVVITFFYFLEYFLKKIFNRNVMLSLIFGANILIAFFTFFSIHQEEKKIMNFQTLKNQIKSEDRNVKKIEILYFNDQFLFLEVSDNKNKRIFIKKFDSLFEK